MDEVVHISVARDKMTAYIRFSAPVDDGEAIPVERVISQIKNSKITYGVNEDYIKMIYEHREYEREYKIAEGKEPENGIDGSIEFKFDFDKATKPKIDEYGNVDYLNVDRFISVKKDEVLAVYTPPTQGVSGINVFGAVIKAKQGKPSRMPVGKNVMLCEDKVTIVSKVDGLLEYTDGRMSVNPVLYISGDVDLSTGNIDFVGSVQIRGGVRNGMKVIAKGNVEVNGLVESAVIETDGDIILNGGIKGMGKAELRAGGRISARYIESAKLVSKQTVTAASILQSDIESQDGVEVIGARANIIGGNIKARNYVKCKSIGSSNYTPTNITVGMSPELKREMVALEKEIQKLKANVANLDKVAGIADTGLSEQQLSIKRRLTEEKNEKYRQLMTATARYNELAQTVETNSRSYVSVEDTAYAGVIISINNAMLNIKTDYKFTTFREVEGEVVPMQHA